MIIANYFFDSLPIDVWQSDEYQLRSCCPVFQLPAGDEQPDTKDPSVLDHLDVQWHKVPTHGDAYHVAEWNDILNEMHRRVGVGSFTMPVCGLETLDLVDSWAERSLLLLSADKGYPSAELYQGRDLPSMSRHGCFSFNVNYAALETWFERRGGRSYLPDYQHGYIETAVMVSSRETNSFSQLGYEAETIEQFSPDEFYGVTKRCDESGLSLRTCLGLLKLSCYEPLLLYRLRRSIRARVEGADASELQMLDDVLQRTWRNNYHLREYDLAFTIGFIYQRMNQLTIALQFYDESLRLFGDNSFTWLNIAGCRYELGQLDDAKAAVARSLELDPDDADAKLLSEELQVGNKPQPENDAHPSNEMNPGNEAPASLPTACEAPASREREVSGRQGWSLAGSA
ncbi:MAG: tetratricopeptide repeat protein [Pirellulales bacterium]